MAGSFFYTYDGNLSYIFFMTINLKKKGAEKKNIVKKIIGGKKYE